MTDSRTSSGKEKDQTQHEDEGSSSFLFAGGKQALIGGIITTAIALSAQLLVGLVYADTQARSFLNTLIPASRMLASSIVTASATILALMLTLISISSSSSKQLEPRFYQQIKSIALLGSISLGGSILLLLFFNYPIDEQQALGATWFEVLYYALSFLVAVITGLFVGVILMLYRAVEDLIMLYHPERQSSLVVEQETDKKDGREEEID